MSAVVIAAVVSAAAALLVSSLSFAFGRRQQRENDWRKIKLDLYREYVAALSGIIEGRESAEAQKSYSDAANMLSLVASMPVLEALYAFLDENSWRNLNRTRDRHDALLNRLLRAMRDDLDPNGRNQPVSFRFISVPPASDQEGRSR